MRLDVYLLLKFVHMNVIFILYFFREAFISDRVILLIYYLDFHLVSTETNKITKITLISTIIIIIQSPGASGRSLLVYYIGQYVTL